MTVTDDGGLSGVLPAAISSTAFVVTYDPAGGFVTGGGSINSPAGSLAADPSAAGRASFGFVAKYQKGATIPEGNTQFHFSAGQLKFKSIEYQWLVVSGARAQYKGTGSINGTGRYAFLLTAIDGDLSGGGGTDRFRIKIWDAAIGDPVYDSRPSGGDDSSAATELIGGSIVIHR